MAPFPSIAQTSRNTALALMLAVSVVVLLACARDRASQDPSMNVRDFPFLGLEITGEHPSVG